MLLRGDELIYPLVHKNRSGLGSTLKNTLGRNPGFLSCFLMTEFVHHVFSSLPLDEHWQPCLYHCDESEGSTFSLDFK